MRLINFNDLVDILQTFNWCNDTEHCFKLITIKQNIRLNRLFIDGRVLTYQLNFNTPRGIPNESLCRSMGVSLNILLFMFFFLRCVHLP